MCMESENHVRSLYRGYSWNYWCARVGHECIWKGKSLITESGYFTGAGVAAGSKEICVPIQEWKVGRAFLHSQGEVGWLKEVWRDGS